MKTIKFLLVLFLFINVTRAQRGVKIGYIDMEYILENVEEYQQANTQLNAKIQKWKREIEQKQNVVEQMKKDLSVEKVLLTEELIEERQAEIQTLEKEMLDYQQDRFGPEGDLVIQKRSLIQPIQDQVFNAVQEIVKNQKYDYVFDKSGEVTMLYSNKKYDISDRVLQSINRTRRRTQYENKTKKNEKSEVKQPSSKKINTSVEKTANEPEIENKKPIVAEQKTDAAKTREEKRQQKIAEREARKKAYEERKKKILAEREAKKQARLKENEKQNEPEPEQNEENNK